jgi:hypothetical protein
LRWYLGLKEKNMAGKPQAVAAAGIALVAAACMISPAAAEKKYGPGVSDSEIKIGQTVHQPDPILAAYAGATREIRRQELGSVRRRA